MAAAAAAQAARASEAFVSLVSNDDCANGAYVLGRSLKNTKTSKKLILMVTAAVTEAQRLKLREVWDEQLDITQNDAENRTLLARPNLGCTLSKLKSWTLTQFDKCVYLDADTLVLQNIDDLFEHDELSAVSEVGWPDCFNSGVFVFKPSSETYAGLLEHAGNYGSFDGSDQGLLNQYFQTWQRIPFVYNTVITSIYSYSPAFKRYGKNIKIVHFSGTLKPWHHHFDAATGKVVKYASEGFSTSEQIFTQMWWDLFTSSCDGDDNLPSWQHWNEARRRAEEQYSDRRKDWEKGQPDYSGEDRFDNILTYMSAMMLKSRPDTAAGDHVTTTDTDTPKHT